MRTSWWARIYDPPALSVGHPPSKPWQATCTPETFKTSAPPPPPKRSYPPPLCQRSNPSLSIYTLHSKYCCVPPPPVYLFIKASNIMKLRGKKTPALFRNEARTKFPEAAYKKYSEKTNKRRVQAVSRLGHALIVQGASPFSTPRHTCRTKASTCAL